MKWSKWLLSSIVWVVRCFTILLIVWGIKEIVVGIDGRWLRLLLGLLIFSLSCAYLRKSWVQVPEEKYMVSEVFSKYWATFSPGPQWLPLWVAKRRSQPSKRTHKYPLFTAPIVIDFKGGGAAIPKMGNVFVRMINPKKKDENGKLICPDAPYRMTYMAPSKEEGGLAGAVVSLIENAARSYINSLDDREAIEKGKAGFDVMAQMREHNDEAINEHASHVEEILLEWGMELLPVKVIFQDFDLSKETLAARNERYLAGQRKKAAVDVASRRTTEISKTLIGVLAHASGRTLKQVQEEINNSNELKRSCLDFTQDMITRMASIDGDALTDIRVSGDGSDLVGAIATFKKLVASSIE
jgi:hypothetical protein